MNKTVTIVPKPLFVQKGSKIFEYSSKSVSICINGETKEDIHNKIQTAFSVAGINTSQSGIPVIIKLQTSQQPKALPKPRNHTPFQ